MQTIVRMDQRGRIVLSQAIQKALGVQGPFSFRAEVVGERLELVPLSAESGKLKRKRGLVVLSTGKGKFNAARVLLQMRSKRW